MGAISKAWVTIADAAVDPDSPIDATLMTGLRDNDIHLREWLGFSFTAGAVQDHNHDGVNSALVPVGANAVRNGSFEDGEGGWTFTNFSGGSHAISTSQHRHGAKSATFTSTVLANGGGDAVTNEFMLVSEADLLALKFWLWASVANVSSKLEVSWYDNAKALISTTVVQSYTDTPTTATYHTLSATAPANARFFKVRVTGGVPGSGSATGTIRCDGIEVSTSPLVVAQSRVFAAVIGRAELKTTTATGGTSVTNGTSATVALTGGTYSWWTAGASVTGTAVFNIGHNDPAAGVIGIHNQDGATRTFNRDERYVQASPPYTHGPTFVFLMVDALGQIVNIEVGFDPPWAYHGPTDITPQFWRDGKPYRRMDVYDGYTMAEVLAGKNDTLLRAILAGQVPKDRIEREITLAYKDTDKDAVPHPWIYNRPEFFTGLTVLMLEPGTTLMQQLEEIAAQSHAREIKDLIRRGYLTIDNRPLAISSLPTALTPCRATWKLTA
jgi:hypothetical protein